MSFEWKAYIFLNFWSVDLSSGQNIIYFLNLFVREYEFLAEDNFLLEFFVVESKFWAGA